MNHVESTRKTIASLKSELTCKLKNRILPGSPLLISCLPGLGLRTRIKSLGKPCDRTSVLEALAGKLKIKRHSTCILYILLPYMTLYDKTYEKNREDHSLASQGLWSKSKMAILRKDFSIHPSHT